MTEQAKKRPRGGERWERLSDGQAVKVEARRTVNLMVALGRTPDPEQDASMVAWTTPDGLGFGVAYEDEFVSAFRFLSANCTSKDPKP